MTLEVAPPHGTRRRYEYRAAPCRCGPCKEANAVYMRSWRQVGSPQLRLPDGL